jgi:hypothetical protein
MGILCFTGVALFIPFTILCFICDCLIIMTVKIPDRGNTTKITLRINQTSPVKNNIPNNDKIT